LPVHAGEIQGKGLGMKVEVFDHSGNNIEHTGRAGELVCTRPHPSLPIAFWGDESGQKLRETYFSFYPGMPKPYLVRFDFHLGQGYGDKVTSW
jgi:acetoacetyl-CoA synthetase